MRLVELEPGWPESWQYSYPFDLIEVYGSKTDPGYTYAYRNRVDRALELVHAVAPAGASVLDVAAGQGNLTLRLAEQGYAVTWNDIRADLEGYVRLKYERGLVEYRPGNILDLDDLGPFDIVLLSEVIEHVAHPDELLRRVASLVRPGGHVVLTTPNGAYFRNPLPRFSEVPDPSVFESGQFRPDADGHIFLLHVDEVRQLAASAGLETESVRLFTTPLTAGHVKTGRLLRVVPEPLVWRLERLSHRLPPGLSRRLHVHLAALLRRPPPLPSGRG